MADDTLGVQAMPNSGSGDPTEPLSPVRAGATDAIDSGDAIPEDHRVSTVRGPTVADSATSVADPYHTEAIASALANGSIDAQTARTRLIEQVVRAQVPADAPSEVVAAIRAEVEALLDTAPVLDRLLRS